MYSTTLTTLDIKQHVAVTTDVSPLYC